MKRIGIIGSSQINGNKDTYNHIIDRVIDTLDREGVSLPIHLISGGSSWSDHIAISLFNKYQEIYLTLYLPCRWSSDKKEFLDTKSNDWRSNPGWLINDRHRKFSKQVSIDSLTDINKIISNAKLIESNINIVEMQGFHTRNDIIAKESDILICLTDNNTLTGGSKYTYDKCKGKKILIDISNKSLNY